MDISKVLNKYFCFFLLTIPFWLGSCSSDDEPEALSEGTVFKEAELVQEFNVTELRDFVNTRPGISLDPLIVQVLAQRDIQVYRLEYETLNTTGETIRASGLVALPQNVEGLNLKLVSVQHGTIFDQEDAPSAFDGSLEATVFATLIASNSVFVAAVPDYIGFGASASEIHPYEHAPSLSLTCLDMLRATREFVGQLSLNLQDSLYLFGYSEGGYASMALHKRIEENNANEFTVIASAPGAGAYHKTAFADTITAANRPLTFINAYLQVLDTYNRVYDINRPWSYYLNEPYASAVEATGFRTSVENNPQLLFTDTLLQSITNRSDVALINAFADNDIFDWRPQAAVRLIHGDADNFVLPFNSQDAFDAMTARGAPTVELVFIPGGTHDTALEPYIESALEFFFQFQ